LNISVAIPPLPEQCAIADILSTVDERIDQTEALIEKTQLLKRGLMQRLLTRGIGHTEFKTTVHGEIPVEWEVVKLGEILTILSGCPFASEYFNEENKGIRLVRIRDVNSGTSNTFYDGPYEEQYVLENGDFIIGMDGDFKILRWKSGPAVLNQRLCKISEKTGKTSLEYIFHCMNPILQNIHDQTAATTVKHLSTKDIIKADIYLPPLFEQRVIADILTSVDDLIDDYQAELAHLNFLKKGLMQQLLTGRTRVPIS